MSRGRRTGLRFGARRREDAAVAREHRKGACLGRGRVALHGLPDRLGGAGRVSSEHRPDRGAGQGQQPQRFRLAALHRRGGRRAGAASAAGGVRALGRTGAEKAAACKASPHPRLVLEAPHPSPLSAYRGFSAAVPSRRSTPSSPPTVRRPSNGISESRRAQLRKIPDNLEILSVLYLQDFTGLI